MDKIGKRWVETSNEHRMETNHTSVKYHNIPETGSGHLMGPQENPWEDKNTKFTRGITEENKNKVIAIYNENETGQDIKVMNNPLMVSTVYWEGPKKQ